MAKPKVEKSKRKTRVVNVRFTSSQYDEILRLLKKAGKKKVSPVIRDVFIEHIAEERALALQKSKKKYKKV